MSNVRMVDSSSSALEFNVIAECDTSLARCADLVLPHSTVATPVFMPVGTQGTLKGLLPEQVADMGCQIMLGNTYHLGHRPGHQLIENAGGLHRFSNWSHSLLTDSGGFQMVSLSKLSEVTEDGVRFVSPHNDQETMLTPEESVHIQNNLGADIIMQLDDVVHVLTTGGRVEEAMHRSIRWLDRCIVAHQRPSTQSLFPIIQGGLDEKLRLTCLEAMIARNQPGYAIGGLSGGEEKDQFWRIVKLCTERLPKAKPRYVMGVGWPVDLVVCSALGADMFDCVFPTRTARFGTALVDAVGGLLQLTRSEFTTDFRPIQSDCPCDTCRHYTRAYLHSIINQQSVSCSLISVHNVSYQLRLMDSIRTSIKSRQFPAFVREFMKRQFSNGNVPKWVTESLQSVGILLE